MIRESPSRYEQKSVRTPASAICVFRPSFAARIIAAASHEAELELGRATDGIIDAALKIPKVIPLKTLLDAYGRGNNLSVSHESDMVDRDLTLKRKKRRGLRM